MTPRSPIRVLLADDNADLREALSSLIEHDEDLELVATARDADEAIELSAREQPDVALIDVRMPAGGGAAAATGVAARSPRTSIVALTASGVLPPDLELLVSGTIVKGLRLPEILASIKQYADKNPLRASRASGTG